MGTFLSFRAYNTDNQLIIDTILVVVQANLQKKSTMR